MFQVKIVVAVFFNFKYFLDNMDLFFDNLGLLYNSGDWLLMMVVVNMEVVVFGVVVHVISSIVVMDMSFNWCCLGNLRSLGCCLCYWFLCC